MIEGDIQIIGGVISGSPAEMSENKDKITKHQTNDSKFLR